MSFVFNVFDRERLDKMKSTIPVHVIGVDHHVIGVHQHGLSYCLCRQVDGKTDILLAKTMDDKNLFAKEFEDLAKYFNAKIITEI